jgi:hypothetical protein
MELLPIPGAGLLAAISSKFFPQKDAFDVDQTDFASNTLCMRGNNGC